MIGQVQGSAEITGGWSVASDGSGSSQGTSGVSGRGGSDPSITLGITSASSAFGSDSIVNEKMGGQNITIPLGGYTLSAGYNGTVNTSLTLEGAAGSGSIEAFIGATATALSTGLDSYDMFGAADLTTNGYIFGQGVGKAYAKGFSYFQVTKTGVPSEVWGDVAGESDLRLEGTSSNALVNTGGATNGLHTDSRGTHTLANEDSASSTSTIISYASIVNDGSANVSSSGVAQGGAWDQSFALAKVKLSNENVATSAKGDLWGFVEANGANDAADVSSIVQAMASKDSGLLVSGGPGSYAASTQSSSSKRTYAVSWANETTQGAAARSKDAILMEWGNLSALGSGAHVYEPGANAISFGRVLQKTDYLLDGGVIRSTGNLSLDTYAEATKGKIAFAGSIIGPTKGDGRILSTDSVMLNEAGYDGDIGDPSKNLLGYSYVDSFKPFIQTVNKIGYAFVNSDPKGDVNLQQPFNVSAKSDPYRAWSSTLGSYDQSH